ncbi:MAG TPA: hypothetical protein VGX78_09885, partial [Pirellulales bacterium]|nr:hypothetical protein [Pirellulales bacterium]
MPAIAKAASDPARDSDWEVWYRDNFDRECPATREVTGRGLVRGLVELWARHLFETVRADGQEGFSDFHLWCDNRRTSIAGPWEGAVRLRRWVFGAKEHSEKGYVAEADANLLETIAAAHAKLHEARQSSEPLLAAARASAERDEFERRLAELAKLPAPSGKPSRL